MTDAALFFAGLVAGLSVASAWAHWAIQPESSEPADWTVVANKIIVGGAVVLLALMLTGVLP